MPINAYDFIFIDGPVNYCGTKATLPDSTRATKRGKTLSADYLNAPWVTTDPVPVLIDQRLDTLWKIMDLTPGCLRERYHQAAMKFEITDSPEIVAALKRLPINFVDKDESLYLSVGQNPPP